MNKNYKKLNNRREIIEWAKGAWRVIMPAFHRERPQSTADEWGYFDLPVEGNLGRKFSLAFMPTVGCRHALTTGCTFCDFGQATKKISEEKMMESAKQLMDHVMSTNIGYDFAIANVNAIGSFFDDAEISSSARDYIYFRIKDLAKDNLGCNRPVEFDTESRLEYVTEEKIKHMREILGDDIYIEIGFGIESSDELIREGIINKCLPQSYKSKLELMKRYNILISSHVILKPLFLTEKEAIEDVVKTINYAYDVDRVYRVVMMTMNIKPATIIGKLEEEGKYELPSIWSVVEVMRRIGFDKSKKTRFFGFVPLDAENRVVTGCNECNNLIMKKIANFSGDKYEYDNILSIADTINCPCKQSWIKKMETEPINSLEERIVDGIDELLNEYIEKSN